MMVLLRIKHLALVVLCLQSVGCRSEERLALRGLSDPSAGQRIRALRILQRSRSREVATQVGRLTQDTSARVRRAAVVALGAIGVGDQLAAVAGRLRDTDLEVRLAAVRVLGGTEEPKARAALLTLARDPLPVVRRAVERSLVQLGMKPWQQRAALATALFQQHLGRLALKDEQRRALAIEALGRSGRAAAVDALLRQCDSPHALVIQAAAEALGRIGGERALRKLSALTRASDRRRRVAGARGVALLSGHPGQHPWALLAPLLSDADEDVRQASLEAAGSIAQPPMSSAAVKAVCNVIDGSGQQSSALAMLGLAALKVHGRSCPSVPGLEKAARVWLASRRADALEGIGGAVEIALRLAVLAPSSPLVGKLAERIHQIYLFDTRSWLGERQWRGTDPPDRGAAASPQGKGSKADREQALRYLLKRFPERYGPEPADPLVPPRVRRRHIAALVVAVPMDPACMRWLAKVALSGDSTLAAQALGRFAQPGVAENTDPALREAVRAAVVRNLASSHSAKVRRAALGACAMLERKLALQHGRKSLSADNFEERQGAAECLGRLRAVDAVPLLIRALEQEWQIAAIDALAKIGDRRAVPALATLLRRSSAGMDTRERIVVLEALGHLGGATAKDVLRRELGHTSWRVRLVAARHLSRMGLPGEEQRLCQQDYNARVRAACTGPSVVTPP